LGDPAQSQPDVFLSYAREDEARARQLATALGQRGFSVFWDREIPPGQTWHSYIGEALANARCVVVAWSRHSVASQWVLEEASEGKDRNVLVPVLFEAVPPPFGFRAIQAASLIDWRPGQRSAAFEGLLGAIRRIVGGQAGSGTGPGVTDEPHSEAAEPSRRQSRAWSRRTVLATVVGLFAIAGGGGATLIWWRTQPGQLDPTALSSTPAASEPVAETMLTTAPEQTITLYFHFSGDPALASDTAAKLRQTGYSVPPIKEILTGAGGRYVISMKRMHN